MSTTTTVQQYHTQHTTVDSSSQPIMSRSLFKSLFTLVMLATIGSVAFARRRSANPQLDSFMNLAERMSDRQHQKFCQRFAAAFDARAAELWPKVHDECIENMIRKGANLPANFPASTSLSRFVFFSKILFAEIG